MATKKTWAYGASLTPAERKQWNKETDAILAKRTVGVKDPEVVAKNLRIDLDSFPGLQPNCQPPAEGSRARREARRRAWLLLLRRW